MMDPLEGTELTITTSRSISPSPPPITNNRVRMVSHNHRVLIYTTCYNVLDGVTLTIRKIEQEIIASGGHVCIVTTKSGDPANTNLDGTHKRRTVLFLDNSIPIPFLSDPNNPELTYHLGFSLSKSILQKINDFEPSLIHITVPDCTGLSLIQYARRKELPLMGTYHSNIPEYMDHYPGLGWLKHIIAAFFRHQYNFLQHLYVPTPFIHHYLCKTYNMDRITSLRVWGRGIDLDKFSPIHRSQKFRNSLGVDDDTPIILWVGRIVPEKRPDIFIDVIKKLHERNVKYHALIIGAGPCEDTMKSLPNTTFVGWLSSDELPVVYASSDIFLFPSAVETFGNVTLEAAASGLPLVVESGCSGHLVQHGKNGYACNASVDENTYFEGTLELVQDVERRYQYSNSSRNDISLNYEKHSVVQQMITNYSTVTDEFYCMYGGHHSNRDEQYMNDPDYSFLGGNHPRPVQLKFVEYIFITLFQIVYYVVSVLIWMHELIIPRRRRNQPQQQPNTTPPKKSTPEKKEPAVVYNPPQQVPTPNITKTTNHQENDGGDIVDVELFEDNNNNQQQTAADNDDMTVTTVSSIGDGSATTSSSLSSVCCSSAVTNNNVCSIAARKISDIPSMLAIAFVKLLQFTFRTESNIRNAAHNCCNGTNNNNDRRKFYGQRKRKNSNMILRGGEEEEDNESTSSPIHTTTSANRERIVGSSSNRIRSEGSSDSESSPFFKELGIGVSSGNNDNLQQQQIQVIEHRRNHNRVRSSNIISGNTVDSDGCCTTGTAISSSNMEQV